MAGILHEIRSHMGNMAMLHERSAQHERRIAEQDQRTSETLGEIKQQLNLVQERLGGVADTVRDEVSGVREEFREFKDQHRRETLGQITLAIEPAVKKAEDASAVAKKVKEDLDGWINRARGGWFIGSILAGLLQSLIVAALVYVGSEVKAMHDWRIQVEARQQSDKRETIGR